MDVISGRNTSTLNPFAAPFVPSYYRAVDDFSEEWWDLVGSSPWFRDYWLRECFEEEPENDPDFLDIYDPALPDIDSLFHSYPSSQQEEEGEKERRRRMEVMTWGAEKWRGPRGAPEGTKYFEKAPKMVNVRVSPRTIQQPR